MLVLVIEQVQFFDQALFADGAVYDGAVFDSEFPAFVADCCLGDGCHVTDLVAVLRYTNMRHSRAVFGAVHQFEGCALPSAWLALPG